MDAAFTRGDAAFPPRAPRKGVELPIAAQWGRIARRFYKFAENLPEPYRDPPPEWFRHPLP